MGAASASGIEVSEGPVLSVVTKRLRALRKKLNRITQMEESVSQGKTLNKEQEDTLRSKPSVLAGIEELEKLRQQLGVAVDQEIALALEKKKDSVESVSGVDAQKRERDGFSGVTDLLNLLYFGTIFDVKTLAGVHDTMLTRTHERNSCLTYDYVTDDDAAGDPLKEWDLDLISALRGLLISRPLNSSYSHKDALQECVERAKLWLENSNQPVEPTSNASYAYLREKLNKIMASEYFTTTPEIKPSVEMAAAAGNYTFQAPAHGSIITSTGVSVTADGSHEGYQQQGEQPNNFYGEVIYEGNQPVEELHQGGSHEENVSEVHIQSETVAGDAKSDQNRDANYEDQYSSRRKHHNPNNRGRGGRGNRGHPSGRGWRGGSRGGHQNGHSQFYDQPQQFNNHRYAHYRGRGGRGMAAHYAPVSHVEAES